MDQRLQHAPRRILAGVGRRQDVGQDHEVEDIGGVRHADVFKYLHEDCRTASGGSSWCGSPAHDFFRILGFTGDDADQLRAGEGEVHRHHGHQDRQRADGGNDVAGVEKQSDTDHVAQRQHRQVPGLHAAFELFSSGCRWLHNNLTI